MSDDLSIGGRVVALDEVVLEGATKLVPRDKIGFGEPGAYADVSAANPLPVGLDDASKAALETITVAPLAAATPYNLVGGSASAQIVAGAGRLMGIAVAETTGTTPAKVRVRDGSGGEILATISLLANESARDWFAPQGIAVATSIYLERVAGSTEATAYKAAA